MGPYSLTESFYAMAAVVERMLRLVIAQCVKLL
jgi:hypothetical protein